MSVAVRDLRILIDKKVKVSFSSGRKGQSGSKIYSKSDISDNRREFRHA